MAELRVGTADGKKQMDLSEQQISTVTWSLMERDGEQELLLKASSTFTLLTFCFTVKSFTHSTRLGHKIVTEYG